jgi:4-alpha-glucanotransferase
MKFERSSGILLHPTSLPGPYGIGDLGPAAYQFVDFLAAAGCKLWQVLPLGPTGYGDSPYQCFSAFAGNPYLISPDFLLRDGLLTPEDFADQPDFQTTRVDFGALIPWKLSLLERAFARFSTDPKPSVQKPFADFCASAGAAWLDDYALFMALKESNGGGSWSAWPEPLRQREPEALTAARHSLTNHVSRFTFYQYLFFQQWRALKTYANALGIRIIGDIPIFVSYDSADVWAHPELFFLDEAGLPTVVAGVPPDYFSPTGQLWGNPLYRWDVHKASGYVWWLERFRAILEMVDIVRLDHFRGFAGYWEVPAGNPTAEIGRWVPGPGADFFTVLQKNLSDLPIIAEDLGVITPDVSELRDGFSLPGMKILQFAFSGPDNPFLPHHYPSHCVAYTGTHDNNTARGWYESASEGERAFTHRYFGQTSEVFAKHPVGAETSEVLAQTFTEKLIRAVWASVAVYALAPMQDLLNLGGEARMNYPSRLGGNWEWRMEENAMSAELMETVKELNILYSR